ncbi:hypothetical protein DK842_06965 [Chromobacterium phragmitis]|uniref:Uncharacterized protein n=1 Tax=Chromobacterium phragmitis TaxID=2202141 RepID=A0A344UIF2_9NEIS|nr:hypothetical protein [Chromobacterium phragmitis]AXE29659.1 hypothetical protein DK842_06965 [Chromobacterium phragmitis]AXE35050.1 hypothetical protein DK843_12530 [Chromobacterium phragmitis]
MLDTLSCEDFAPLIGHSCRFQAHPLPELELKVQSIRQKPLSQVPGREGVERTPFVVELVAASQTDLVDAVGRLSLPAVGALPERTLDNVWISRTGAMGRDRSHCYFQLPFN